MNYNWVNGKRWHEIFEKNPEFSTVEEYKVLSGKEMCFVVLLGDYKSEFMLSHYGKEEEVIREEACRILDLCTPKGKLTIKGKKLVECGVEKVEIALELMKKGSDKDLRRTLEAASKKIDEFIELDMDELDAREKSAHINTIVRIIQSGTIPDIAEQKKVLSGIYLMGDKELADNHLSKTTKAEDGDFNPDND